MDFTEVAVIGAGVVGLAVARAIAALGLETLVLERNARPGEETTSRNSGVIHSGIYYPSGSLKAGLCVRGRQLLYSLCAERAIAHQRCGKLIVAGEVQLAALRALHARARANGVTDLRELGPEEVRRLEPEVSCAAALHCPSTGIIDVHELLLVLLADLEAAGGTLLLQAEVVAVRQAADHLVVTVQSGDSSSELGCKWLVNCAGLCAISLLRRIQGYPPAMAPHAYFAKGSYFACQGARPFRRLVYPMPNEAGLGIHATIDLAGMTRFGPDVQWLERPEYTLEPQRAEAFYAAIREYWPTIPAGALAPAYAGVRPKLVGPGAAAADFKIEAAAVHGVAGLINLLGIESPGLTASLAIGEHVAAMISG